MPAGFVRYTNFVEEFGASGLTSTIPGAAPASGNSLLLVIRNSYAPSDINPISVSDNQGNTYILDLEGLGRSEGLHGVFRCHNITNAPTSLTFTWAGGGSRYITYGIAEISGLTNAAPTDTAHNRIVTDGTGAISTTVTTAGAGEFVCAFLGHTSFDITVDADYTRTPTGAVANSFIYDLDAGAAGDKTPDFASSANDTCAIFALSYAVAGTGPAPAVRAAVMRQMLNN